MLPDPARLTPRRNPSFVDEELAVPNEHDPAEPNGAARRRTQRPVDDEDDDAREVRRRPRHIVDRAREYLALQRQGFSQREIARRRRRSKGYVSILLRFGLALDGLTDLELEIFRSDRISWRLVQRLVRRNMSPGEIREQLRFALGGFSTHNIDRRKYRRQRRSREEEAAAPPAKDQTGIDVGWVWNPHRAQQDPTDYLRAYRAYLAGLHRVVSAGLRAVLASRAKQLAPNPGMPVVGLVGQPLAMLVAATRLQMKSSSLLATPSPEAREILQALGALDSVLLGADIGDVISGSVDASEDAPGRR